MNSELSVIKSRFYQLVGALSIEEIMSNPLLIEKIKIIAGLLVVLTR